MSGRYHPDKFFCGGAESIDRVGRALQNSLIQVDRLFPRQAGHHTKAYHQPRDLKLNIFISQLVFLKYFQPENLPRISVTMNHRFTMLDSLLSMESVSLGRLTRNLKDLVQGFHDPTPAPDASEILHETAFSNYNLRERSISDNSLDAKLTPLLTALYGSGTSSEDSISALRIGKYTLLNSDVWFEKICKTEDTRKWLETKSRSQGAYLIVGYNTISDAQIAEQFTARSQCALHAVVPLGQVLAVVPDATGIGDVGAQGDHLRSIELRQSVFAPGEHVYKVAYRKINFSWISWFRPHPVDTRNLSNTEWQVSSGLRSGAVSEKKDQEKKITILKVALSDKMDGDSSSSDAEG